MKKKHLILLVIVFIFIKVKAQTDTIPEKDFSEYSIEELIEMKVYTASSKSEKIEDAPANIFIITGAEMQNRGYRTLYDLLPDLPGTTWTSLLGFTTNGTPIIRGISDGKRLKLILNGMSIDPKNGFGTGWIDRFPIEGIDRVEFILGPYASVYGRNTFSGVINIITKSGKKINGDKMTFVYGEHDRFQGSVIIGKKFKKTDIYLSLFKNFSQNGIDMAKEYPEYYGLESRKSSIIFGDSVVFPEGVSTDFVFPWNHNELYLKVKHDIGIQFDIQVNHSQYPKVGNGLSPLLYASPKEAITNDNILNTRLLYDFNSGDKFSSTSSVIFQNYSWIGRNFYLTGDKKWYSQKAQSHHVEHKMRYKIFDWNEIYLGAAYENVTEHFLKTSFEEEKPKWSSREIKTKQYLTLTLQEEVTLFKRLSLIAGLMYEKTNVYDDVFVPRFSAIWKFKNSSAIKFMYGGGYLAPDPIVGVDQIVPGGHSVLGVTDINPEYVTSYDLNLTYLFYKDMRINISFFLNKVKDKLLSIVDSTLPEPYEATWENIGKTESKGVDLSLDWRYGEYIKSFISYSYVTGYFDEVNSEGVTQKKNRLPASAEHHFKIGTNIMFWKGRFNLYIHDLFIGDRATYYDKIDDSHAYQIDAPGYKIPGYNLVDINLSTTSKLLKKWVISVGIKNLFDKKGYDVFHLEGIVINCPPIMRRNWTIQLRYFLQ